MDAYTWAAVMRDGQIVTEADLQTFTAVASDAVRTVALMPAHSFGRFMYASVPEGARAVCFRRRTLVVSLTGASEPERVVTATVIGWETETGGSYLYVLDSGLSWLSTNRELEPTALVEALG